jgi:hypothetical protein
MTKPTSNSTPISIMEYEQKIESLRNNKTKNSKQTIEQLKTNLNHQYIENKSKISNFEKDNFEYIACFRSTNNFYKLIGNSTLFYACDIAKKLNITVNIQADGDYYDKSSTGVVSIRKIDAFIKNLTSLKITKIKTKDQTGDILLFKLPWKYTQKQIDEMLVNNVLKLKNFNHIVMVNNICPTLHIQSTELIKAVYENVRKMPSEIERQAFGYYCITRSMNIFHSYLDLTNGRANKKVSFLEIQGELNLLKNQAKVLADLNIWNAAVCGRIGDTIIKIQNIIKQELSAGSKNDQKF